MQKSQQLVLIALLIAIIAAPAMSDPTLTPLATFTFSNGVAPNGIRPQSGLIFDATGNLYGTTLGFGQPTETSTVYQVAAGTHALTTVASLSGVVGYQPFGNLVADTAGNLYGTTSLASYTDGYSDGVFKVAAGTHSVSQLASLSMEGSAAGVIFDSNGNLYGTTVRGGTYGAGTVFKVAADTNALTTLASFNPFNKMYGYNPEAGLIADGSGNLFGTTVSGGVNGYGTLFKVAAGTNALTTQIAFNGLDGSVPQSNLIADANGNLYGTTAGGGTNKYGTVFEYYPNTNTLTTLASFNDVDGADPSSLILDSAGNLFGTTNQGGAYGYGPTGQGNNYNGDGTVFELTAGSSTITTLFSFNGANGQYPAAGLIADPSGNLYGTTVNGGSSNDGTVFEVSGAGFVVPEPGSLSLLGLAVVGVLGKRRKRSEA